MSQEPGLDGDVHGPADRYAAPWSAPDATGDGRATSVAGVPTPAVQTARPVYRPQPDGIPLRPLGVGELLDGTFSTIRRNHTLAKNHIDAAGSQLDTLDSELHDVLARLSQLSA